MIRLRALARALFYPLIVGAVILVAGIGAVSTPSVSPPSGAQAVTGGMTTGPQGPAGTNGTNGAAATMTVGSVAPLSPGSTPTVTNSGTSSAAVLNFGLVTGNAGSNGAAGVNSFGAPTARTLSMATAYQASNTAKPAEVSFSLSSAATLTLTGGTPNSATVYIGSTSAVASGTGMAVCQYTNTNAGTLTIGLNLVQTLVAPCQLSLPTGWFFAIVQTSGSVSIINASDQSVG